VLELAVLGLLKEKPMSGYELQKQLTAKLGAFWRVSFGSLYPCLKRLSGQGALEVVDPPAIPAPATRSRRKHVYRLTERGEQLFQELLESADVHDLEQDRFPLRLAFFRYLQPETRLDQLERRRGYLQQRLGDLRVSMRTARDRMDAYTLSLLDHGLEEREREIAWLDRLIAAERDAGAIGAAVPLPEAEDDPADQPGARRRRSSTRRATRRRRLAAGADEQPFDPDAPIRARPAPASGPAAPQPAEGRETDAAPDGGNEQATAPQTPTDSDPALPAPAGGVAETRRISG